MNKETLEIVAFLTLCAGVSTLLFFVFAPFVPVLTLATVLAILFHKPYEKLKKVLNGFESVAASIVVLVVLLFFIVPLFLLGWQIVLEAQNLYTGLQGTGTHYLHVVQALIEQPIQAVFPNFTFTLSHYLGILFEFVSSNLGILLSGTVFVLFETFLMLLAFFFFLRDGESLIVAFHRASPFCEEQTREILNNMKQTIDSIMKGTLFVGLIRWVLISVGFSLLGIPNAILWGSIGGIIGAIPGLGTPFAFIPAIIFLYLEGSIGYAVGLTLYGLCVIVLSDNILIPYFFGKGLNVSPVFMLFSILGGIIFFGPLGFILGPLVLSVFLSVIHMYRVLMRERGVTR